MSNILRDRHQELYLLIESIFVSILLVIILRRVYSALVILVDDIDKTVNFLLSFKLQLAITVQLLMITIDPVLSAFELLIRFLTFILFVLLSKRFIARGVLMGALAAFTIDRGSNLHSLCQP